MNFWPMSEIAELAPPAYAQELRNFCYQMPSEGAYYAAFDTRRRLKPVEAPNLVIIETLNGAARRTYVDYPEFDEWTRLERATLMENDNGYVFALLDGLH